MLVWHLTFLFCIHSVSFTVKAKKEKIDEFERETGGLYKKFKLTSSINETNMVVFNEGQLVKFENPLEILHTFFRVRYEFYEKRKELLVQNLRLEQSKLSNKARFVEEVCAGDLVVSNRKRADILNELQERGYELFDNSKKGSSGDESDQEIANSEDEEDEPTTAELAKGYEYLLGMKIWSLTFEKAEALRNELADKTQELESLLDTSPSEIWLNDLSAIEEALDDRDAALSQIASEEKRAQAKSKKIRAKAAKKNNNGKGKKKKTDEWDSNDEESDEDKVVLMTDSSDDESEKVSIVKRKPAAIKKVVASVVPSVVKRKPAAAMKEVEKPVVVKKEVEKPVSLPTKTSFDSESADDDDGMLSLTQRMQQRFGTDSVDPSPKSMSSEDSLSALEAPVTKEVPVTRKAPAKKKAAPKKAAPKKKTAVFESEEESADEFEFHSDEDEEEVMEVTRTAAASRSRRAPKPTAKKATYTFSSEEDGSEDEESDDEW